MKKIVLILFGVLCVLAAERIPAPPSLASQLLAPIPAGNEIATAELKAFSTWEPIDAHVHAFKTDPAFFAMMKDLHLHVLDICVADSHNLFRALVPELANAKAFVRSSHGHATLCTTFDPYRFGEPNFADEAIKQINRDLAEGAVAVKIWKNIGMELKTREGKYLMPDDPIFESIYKNIAAHNKTLIAHVAEPTICWRPLDPADPSSDYYKEHPEWHMYLQPDHPSKETLLAARDRLLQKHPKLRVVGAHLGSMELDVDEIARHFDRYPNFAVDTSARMEYLMLQPRKKVKNFLIKYQDRVLYATDQVFQADDSPANARKEWLDAYTRDWTFLATDQPVEYQGRKIRGLKLPGSVLRKLFHDNAVRWIPGIVPAVGQELRR